MKNDKKIPQKGPTIEEEIRRGRKFDLSEAVGRQAAGALKGASPIPKWRQVLGDIQMLLDSLLHDPEGSLNESILDHLKTTLPVADDPRKPAEEALTDYLRQILGSPSALADLVRRADVHWGRQYGEKPYFHKEGEPPHPDDPYTLESVARTLENLLHQLD